MLLGSPLILPGHGTRTPQLHSEGCSPRLNIRDSQSIHEWHAPHSVEINCSPCPGARCRRRTGVRVTAVAELARPVVTTKPQSNKVLVRMSVPFRVAFGQVIKVVGSAKEFGAWDVSAAPRFEWTEGDIWVGNFCMDPGLYEYKVVIFNEQSQESRWESGINRVVEVPKGPGTLTTSCYWGAPSTQGWFDKGEVDSSIKITKLDKAPIKATPQGPPAVLLQKGWDAMYERSKSPERERSLTPELARPSARRTTPRVGGSAGASVRPNKWASVVDKEEALEEAVRAMKAKKKTLPTVSKPVRSDSGAVREGRDKDSAATLAGRALRDDITEFYEHGGERVMRSLSGMLSSAQGSGVVRDGLRQLKNLESHVVLRNMRDALSDGGSELMRGGLKQLREVDSRVVFKNVRDAMNSLANSEETAHLQRMGRKQSSIVPSQVLEEGERFFKAVSSVVSTKSPSAIRGEAIDEEAFKESYRRKKPLTATASRRPTPEPVPGRADPIGRLRASQEALARSASAVGKTPTTTGSSSSRSSSRSPSPEPTRHLELPKIELPAVGITLDTSFLSGAALVAAVVLSVLTTDTHGIRSTLIGRADALKAALVEPLPPKVSGKTPKPSRAASPATPAKPQGQAAKPAAQSQAAQAKSAPAAKPAAPSQPAQPAQAKSTAASSAAPKPSAPGQPAEAKK